MGKEQEHISFLLDSNGKMIDFERWQYKRLDTIKEKLKQLYTSSVYKKDLEHSETIEIYKTDHAGNNKMKVWESKVQGLYR